MPEICEVCDKTLANSRSLSQHVRRQHSDVFVREHILAMKAWRASPEGRAWAESGRPWLVPRRQGSRDVVTRLIDSRRPPTQTRTARSDMQQRNEYGQITDPGEAHLMAAVMEAARQQQEMLEKLLPHLDETTQAPGETERDVLTRMFTSPELDQEATDAWAGMFGDEHGRLADGS